MKKIALTFMTVIAVSFLAVAQQEELRSAVTNLEKKDYIAALDDINSAKTKVTAMMGEQLAAVLPQKFGEFEMNTDQNGDMGMGMGQGMSVYKVYRKPQKEVAAADPDAEGGMPDDPAAMDPAGMDPMMGGMGMPEEISVQITTDMMMASEVQMAHSGSNNGMMGDDMKAIRVKGYRAMVRTQSYGMPGEAGFEEAMAIVGGAFVTVRAQGVKEKGQAEKLLNLIDFDKLKTIVGE